MQPEDAARHALHDSEVVRDEKNSLAFPLQFPDEAIAFVLEGFVPDSENFVHEQNVRVGMHGNRKAEPKFRPVVPAVKGRIRFLFQFRKI